MASNFLPFVSNDDKVIQFDALNNVMVQIITEGNFGLLHALISNSHSCLEHDIVLVSEADTRVVVLSKQEAVASEIMSAAEFDAALGKFIQSGICRNTWNCLF